MSTHTGIHARLSIHACVRYDVCVCVYRYAIGIYIHIYKDNIYINIWELFCKGEFGVMVVVFVCLFPNTHTS